MECVLRRRVGRRRRAGRGEASNVGLRIVQTTLVTELPRSVSLEQRVSL